MDLGKFEKLFVRRYEKIFFIMLLSQKLQEMYCMVVGV